MRTIKFRAWEKQKLQWVDIFDVTCFWDILSVWYSHLWEPWTILNDKVILMQFTWLLDKNGKDVYEGDILYYPVISKYPLQVIFIDWWFMLTWKHFSFWCKEEKEIREDVYFWWYEWMREIIWNIYENPELLKQ